MATGNVVNSAPNTRVQRTRSSPSARRSPLTRSPLGRSLFLVSLLLLPSRPVLSESKGSSSKRPVLRCSSLILGPSSLLTLTMRVPHGGDLGIVTPDGKFLFVCYFQGDRSIAPLVAFERFSKMPQLQLAVASAEATDWGAEEPVKVRIFQRSGSYRILLSQNLETDQPDTDECVVHFSASRDK